MTEERLLGKFLLERVEIVSHPERLLAGGAQVVDRVCVVARDAVGAFQVGDEVHARMVGRGITRVERKGTARWPVER